MRGQGRARGALVGVNHLDVRQVHRTCLSGQWALPLGAISGGLGVKGAVDPLTAQARSPPAC